MSEQNTCIHCGQTWKLGHPKNCLPKKKTLPDDILGAKFGTKNRSELIPRVDNIKHAIKDIIWMARRYANGRQTYAPSNFNDAYDILRAEFGDDIDPQNALDMLNNKYHDITIEHTKRHPYALYSNDEDRETNREIKERRFYPKDE